VLAVVQHQQQAPGPQRRRERLEQRPPGLLADPRGRGGRLGHQRGVGQGRQLHQPDAVRVRRPQGPRRLERQAGLAHAPGAGQRHQARAGGRPGQQPRHLGPLRLPADEGGQRRRQVPRRGGGRPPRPRRWDQAEPAAGGVGGSGGPRGRRGRGQEPRPLRRGEPQPVGQAPGGAPQGGAGARLQPLQGAHPHPGPLGQRLLRQPGTQAVAPQRRAERVAAHPAGRLRLRDVPVLPHPRPRSPRRRGPAVCRRWGADAGTPTGSRGARRPARTILTPPRLSRTRSIG
jgi:hypothetical protein